MVVSVWCSPVARELGYPLTAGCRCALYPVPSVRPSGARLGSQSTEDRCTFTCTQSFHDFEYELVTFTVPIRPLRSDFASA